MKTEFPDYTLWYDGVVEIAPWQLPKFLIAGGKLSDISLTATTPDINDMIASLPVNVDPPEIGKRKLRELSLAWTIPQEYKSIDVVQLVESLIETESEEKRRERLAVELGLYIEYGMTDVLRCVVWIIDQFREKGIVWGVGRGSSSASYILFRLGLHCVDSVKYDIPVDEFFH